MMLSLSEMTVDSKKIRGMEVEDRYVEEIEPVIKEEFVTWRQTTDIWDGKEWKKVGVRFGDVASRNITNDVRKLITENTPLKKRPYRSDRV